MKKLLLLLLPSLALAQPQQGGGPFPSGGGGNSNQLSGSFIAINNGAGTNTTFRGTASNTAAINIVGNAQFGRLGGLWAGTNIVWGSEGPFFSINVSPYNNAYPFTINGQAGFIIQTNLTSWSAAFINAYNHGGADINGNEAGVLADGAIHIKPAVNSAGFATHVGRVYIGGFTPAGNSIQIGGGSGNRFGESGLLQFVGVASTAPTATDQGWSGQTPTLMSRTNGAGVATLYAYNPPPTYASASTNWTGGVPQWTMTTNTFNVTATNFNVVGSSGFTFIDNQSVLGDHAVLFNNAFSLAQFGYNGARTEYGATFNDTSGNTKIALGANAVVRTGDIAEFNGGAVAFATNALASWPTTPPYGGACCLVNSNGSLFLLLSLPKTLTWNKTQLIAHPF